jgi:lipopolysaccharide transport system permease protein
MSDADSPTTILIRRGIPERIRGTGVVALLRSVYKHRFLVNELSRREVTDVHAGQAGGVIWVVVHPLTYFVIFAFLFTSVFKVRIGDRGPTDYMVYLFAGLAPWLMTQDVLSRATTIMISNATIVKKVMFPTEALVAKSLLASLKVQGVLLAVVTLYTIWVRGTVPASFLLLPVVLPLHLTLVWGLSLLLSATSPYFRDLTEFVRVFLLVNIYLVPIMYLPDMVPEGLRFVLSINPFSHLVWCYQDVFYFNAVHHPVSWVVLSAFSGTVLLAGSYVFVRLRHHLASVI